MADERFNPPPRPMRRSRKAVYVIPSLLTTANIFCGFYSVMESLRAFSWLGLVDFFGNPAGPFMDLFAGRPPSLEAIQQATEHFDRAAITIGFAALFDLL